MKEKIETIANIVFIAMVLLIGGIAIKKYIMVSNSNEPEPRVGTRLPDLPGYEWKAHDFTLAIALKKNCQYCENSMPFYRKLIELKQAGKISAHIISVFSDSLDKARSVIETEKLAIDAVGGVQWSNYRISGTPTLILVNKQGQVVKSWVGQVPKDIESEVIRTLSAGS